MDDLLAQAIELGGRVLLAAILGVMIAYRRRTDRHHQNILHTHVYLAIAGAMFILIIGHNFERAIGLVGVATIIRYRYAIRNPKDAGTLIIALGMGMACGTGELVYLAIIGTVLMMGIVRLLDLLPSILPGKLFITQNETRLRITSDNPEATMRRAGPILDRHGIDYWLTAIERRRRDEIDATMVEAQLRFEGDIDITSLTAELSDEHVVGMAWRLSDPSDYWA